MIKNPDLTDVKRRRAQIVKQRAALIEEDEELEIAERVLSRLVQVGEPRQREHEIKFEVAPVFAMRSKPTMKEMITKALRESDRLWISANDVQRAVSLTKGTDVPMPSISPILSVMKKEGTIRRDGLKIALASRVKNNETPQDEQSRDVSKVTGEAVTSPNENQKSPNRDIFG